MTGIVLEPNFTQCWPTNKTPVIQTVRSAFHVLSQPHWHRLRHLRFFDIPSCEVMDMDQYDMSKALTIVCEHFEEIDAALT